MSSPDPAFPPMRELRYQWLRNNFPEPVVSADARAYDLRHQWLKRMFPKSGVCETCGEPRKRTDYATLLKGEQGEGLYTFERSNYIEVCIPCHRTMDKARYAKTPEQRAAIGAQHKGRKRSAETKAKQSAAHLALWAKLSPDERAERGRKRRGVRA